MTASAVNKADGSTWYVLLDYKVKTNYYIRAEHVRLITTEELAPLSPEIPNADKRIEVRMNDQMVLAYEKENLVYAVRVSTGSRLNSRRYSTPNGEFITYHKRPTRHMATGDIASNGFDLPGVPWVLYITEKGISFHGTYWHLVGQRTTVYQSDRDIQRGFFVQVICKKAALGAYIFNPDDSDNRFSVFSLGMEF